MTSGTELYIAAYDIRSNPVRRRVADILERHGVRVQDSVFELRCRASLIGPLVKSLEQLLEVGDSLRLYPVPDAARRRAVALGGPPISEPGPFWMV